jgi:hypothetical protein
VGHPSIAAEELVPAQLLVSHLQMLEVVALANAVVTCTVSPPIQSMDNLTILFVGPLTTISYPFAFEDS